MLRYRATIDGASLPEYQAKGDRAAVDAARAECEALHPEGDHTIEVHCLDEVMTASGDVREPCQVTSFSVTHAVPLTVEVAP